MDGFVGHDMNLKWVTIDFEYPCSHFPAVSLIAKCYYSVGSTPTVTQPRLYVWWHLAYYKFEYKYQHTHIDHTLMHEWIEGLQYMYSGFTVYTYFLMSKNNPPWA